MADTAVAASAAATEGAKRKDAADDVAQATRKRSALQTTVKDAVKPSPAKRARVGAKVSTAATPKGGSASATRRRAAARPGANSKATPQPTFSGSDSDSSSSSSEDEEDEDEEEDSEEADDSSADSLDGDDAATPGQDADMPDAVQPAKPNGNVASTPKAAAKTKVKVTPKAKDRALRPTSTSKKGTPKAESPTKPIGGSPDADSAASSSPNTNSAAYILTRPKMQLTDAAVDELIPLIVANERGSTDDGRVVVISSKNMQAVLARYHFRTADVTTDNVYKLLGTTRERMEAADVVMFVVHGPHTEEQRSAHKRYSGSELTNYHWTLACWFPKLGSAFHYDSCHRMNAMRCGTDVFGTMRKVGVLPSALQSYTQPEFFPGQEDVWECGYFLLIAVTIMCAKPAPEPITEYDVDTQYDLWFGTLSNWAHSAFVRRLTDLVTRAKYARARA